MKSGQILNDNPNPFVQKPRTSIDFLFPDTPAKIDQVVIESLKYKQPKSQVCPHCGKKI